MEAVKNINTTHPEELLALTKEHLQEIENYIEIQLSNQTLSELLKKEAAQKAEAIYRSGMWQLLEKVKEVTGETSAIYQTACEFHGKAVYSLGNIFVWAKDFEHGIGLYNTALELVAHSPALVEKYQEALAQARMLAEDSLITAKLKVTDSTDFAKVKNLPKEPSFPYLSIAFFVMLGLFFTVVCFCLVLFFLDTVFLY